MSTTAAVIGTGRFGTLWTKYLSQQMPVVCYDKQPDNYSQTTAYATPASLQECLNQPLVFLTIPIRHLEDFLQNHHDKFSDDTLVVDCASVKAVVVDWFKKYLPERVSFAATHPLFGPDSASHSLKGQTIVCTPGRLKYSRYRSLIDLFESGMGLRVLSMSAEEHDRMMAYNLSLIHHIGRAFDELRISQLPLVMPNLVPMRHISRVATNDSVELFEDFYRFNHHAADVRDAFVCAFSKVDALVNK